MEVSGVIGATETAAALAGIKARRGLSPRQAKWIPMLSIMAVGIPVIAWITGSWAKGAASVETVVITLFTAGLVVEALRAPTLRRALTQRGLAFDQPMTLRLTPEAVVLELGAAATTAPWSCVTEIYRTKRSWVFLAQTGAMVLPRRLFGSAEEEGRFMAEALGYLTPAARARSPEAVAGMSGG